MPTKATIDRKQYVVKSNELIRKTRYSMTTQQQKIILYAISKIKPYDAPGTRYTLSIDDICTSCGLNYDKGGYYYKAIKDDIRELTSRIWIKMPDGKEKTVSWIGDAEIEPNNGTLIIQFHKDMEPFLFDLKSHYTQYKLENVLAFRSKYAIRLYEIIRSFVPQQAIEEGKEKEVSFTLDELREMLDISKGIYERWVDFNRYVIKKAVDEINIYCGEIHIDYDIYKKGRRVDTIVFIITPPTGIEKYNTWNKRKERLTSI